MNDKGPLRFETLAIHAGAEPDQETGAIAPPIHLSTTFRHGPAGERVANTNTCAKAIRPKVGWRPCWLPSKAATLHWPSPPAKRRCWQRCNPCRRARKC